MLLALECTTELSCADELAFQLSMQRMVRDFLLGLLAARLTVFTWAWRARALQRTAR